MRSVMWMLFGTMGCASVSVEDTGTLTERFADEVAVDAERFGLSSGLRVVLRWAEPGADLDLHFARDGAELFDVPDDVSFCNENPQWGSSARVGNPMLVDDAQEGPGSETVVHRLPADGIYDVNVHYYTDDGAHDLDATVWVYLDGRRVFSGTQNIDTNRVWHVGSVKLPAGSFRASSEAPEIHMGDRTCRED